MKKEIRRLTSQDAKIYEELLRKSFGHAEGFMVRQSGFLWSPAESYYMTLGIFHDGLLVSTMRTEWVLSQKELEFKLGGSYVSSDCTFPAMYLTKAGTLPGIKTQGLNSILRLISLQLAVAWNIRFIYGSMVENSPRVFTMEKMGYEFKRLNKKWNGDFISERYPLAACLDLNLKKDQAMHYLDSKVGHSFKEYVLNFIIEDLKMSLVDTIRWPWSA